MFRVNKTQHVLAVTEFEQAIAYFVDKLGFTESLRIDGWSFLQLDNFYLMVGDCRGIEPVSATQDHSYFAYVNCEDIDELFEAYRSRGVMFTQKLSNKPWGMREFGVVTPEGHRIMFGQEI